MIGDMMTLNEFLTARIDEDEAAAVRVTRQNQAAYFAHPAEWLAKDSGLAADVAAATVRFANPARVLAEVEAKRRIVEAVDVLTGGTKTYDERMRHTDVEDAHYVIAHDILRLLALPYADHPDWREEWRP